MTGDHLQALEMRIRALETAVGVLVKFAEIANVLSPGEWGRALDDLAATTLTTASDIGASDDDMVMLGLYSSAIKNLARDASQGPSFTVIDGGKKD